MTDRELLELAAKAAGYPWRGFSAADEPLLEQDMSKPEPRLYCPVVWNPLDDDGDALRLAVKLEINVLPNMEATSARQPSYTKWCNEDARTDPYAATRRAIVRAAAEIGRSME